MKKPLRDTGDIERFLDGVMPPGEKAAFRTRLLLEPGLREQTGRQRLAYDLIRHYGRRKLRRELEQIHRRLMARPSFGDRIRRIFSSSSG